MTGTITATNHGVFALNSSTLKTKLDTLNCGSATAGAEITSIYIVPVGNGQCQVIALARAA